MGHCGRTKKLWAFLVVWTVLVYKPFLTYEWAILDVMLGCFGHPHGLFWTELWAIFALRVGRFSSWAILVQTRCYYYWCYYHYHISTSTSATTSRPPLLLQLQVLQGGPIKTAHFLRYHIFAATADIVTWFLLKCSEITAENNKQQFFFKRVLIIFLQTSQNMVPCKCQC